ncbi:MAG: hypothetical protein Q8P54_01960, partial [bacterium]|nr:hypothetical protein [bacterium]
HEHETGLTPEAYLMAQLDAATTGQPLDIETYTWLIGAFFTEGAQAGQVPFAYWSTDNGQLYLYANYPDLSDSDFGVRSTVRVT